MGASENTMDGIFRGSLYNPDPVGGDQIEPFWPYAALQSNNAVFCFSIKIKRLQCSILDPPPYVAGTSDRQRLPRQMTFRD